MGEQIRKHVDKVHKEAGRLWRRQVSRLEGKHTDRHDVFKNRVVTCLQRKQLGRTV